jgi:glycosyltransferase involved in cell wall biosynthesis
LHKAQGAAGRSNIFRRVVRQKKRENVSLDRKGPSLAGRLLTRPLPAAAINVPEIVLRILYYMPFKPLGHPNPSGDLVIGSGIFMFLQRRGHRIRLASRMRLRWFYWQPHVWLRFFFELGKVSSTLRRTSPDAWLTYHSYYKAPDLLGALSTLIRPLPYFIFQGVYATKRKRHWKTRPGFLLNRWVLRRADTVFTNKRIDEVNLKRLLPAARVQYVAPGVDTTVFQRDPNARQSLRSKWRCGQETVILTAAMFRPGVKTEGLAIIIQACHSLKEKGRTFRLVICGEGATKNQLHALARQCLGNRVIFTGRMERDQMHCVYSAADLFAFPGIHEGLGMVYLEAQACGLPVVAYNRWGAAEVVRDGRTGLLSSPDKPEALRDNLDQFIQDRDLRLKMGAAARVHVTRHHDQALNYQRLEALLQQRVAVRR